MKIEILALPIVHVRTPPLKKKKNGYNPQVSQKIGLFLDLKDAYLSRKS